MDWDEMDRVDAVTKGYTDRGLEILYIFTGSTVEGDGSLAEEYDVCAKRKTLRLQ